MTFFPSNELKQFFRIEIHLSKADLKMLFQISILLILELLGPSVLKQ